jgi:osmotically-inducible protein OsmY
MATLAQETVVPMQVSRRFRFVLILVAAGLLSGCVAGDIAGLPTDERTVAAVATDTRIRAELNEKWFSSDLKLYQQVHLIVHDRRVLLTGAVERQELREDAVKTAWAIEGVREVLDELIVDPTNRIGTIASDNAIVTELRGRLLFDKQIASVNYRFDAVNGTVYLIGVARDQAELDRALAHARALDNVRRVVNFVLLRNDPKRA